jgi:hypothetical protein
MVLETMLESGRVPGIEKQISVPEGASHANSESLWEPWLRLLCDRHELK